ncbi:MAG TPA: DUF6141 family protein [Candidatus Hydrogenedentes bacterium]|nr:DUF6141 family protein [Candidatus Hydrogenedentota bacterium]HPG67954.1 DUF6141 family protein [Candidatus Hydrogenedentota bacterium]
MVDESEILFREEQRFAWAAFLSIPLALFVTGLFGYGVVQQLILGMPWGQRPMPDWGLVVTAIGMTTFSWTMAYILVCVGMTTEVRRDGLYIKFFPLHWSFRRLSLDGVERCEARTYRPIREYGGWGIRGNLKGRAYNVSGSRGVRIDYWNGRHLLLGSQRSEELAEAIRSLLS